MSSKWNTSSPPRRRQRPVRLQVQSGDGMRFTSDFVWSDREGTFLQCDTEDGVGLYEDDGWKILAWR